MAVEAFEGALVAVAGITVAEPHATHVGLTLCVLPRRGGVIDSGDDSDDPRQPRSRPLPCPVELRS